MAASQDLFREVRHLFDVERPDVRAELVRVAGVLSRRGCRSIGLAPAADDVGVPAIALQMGLAFVELTGQPTGVIDAQGSWDAPERPPARSGDASILATTWLTDKLALLAPRAFSTTGMLLDLAAFLRGEAQAMGYLVVDMTGFQTTGEHLELAAMLDAVAVVARAGFTTASQVERWVKDFPPRQNLGVLLTGL